MHPSSRRAFRVRISVLFAFILLGVTTSQAQSNSGIVSGTVTDPGGALIPGAAVTIANPISGYTRSATTDAAGHFQFTNLPLNSYHLTAAAAGFGPVSQDAAVPSGIPVTLTIALKIEGTSTAITVEGEDLLSSDPTNHTNIDRELFNRLPLESQSSSLSSLVTLASPGVSADSNGLFHGLGDHASNSFSVDGQPITDQQSKVFSNQIPSNAIQSIEAIPGAPPAEYGGKTSLIINVTTRSGQGSTTPHGSITASYGSFGSASSGVDLAYGGEHWGNFIELDGLNTGRFLDGPEFAVFHDRGNELNFFDRLDRSFTAKDSTHLNANYTRSWFQTPNTFDNIGIRNVVAGGASSTPVFGAVGNTDQRAKIETYDLAPLYTRIIGDNALFNFGAFLRRDGFNYYPSRNQLADLGPIQNQTIAQQRSLLNAGLRTDYSTNRGRHTVKIGALYQHTFLREHDSIALVNALSNPPCLGASRTLPGFTDPGQCTAAGALPNTGGDFGTSIPFNPVLLPYDLTRGGTPYAYFGHADIKELALYVQDQIKAGNWLFNVGLRGDLYNGLTVAHQAEPRLGLSYSLKKTGSVLRASYARTLESPFNENLVVSSQGCANPVLRPLLSCTPGVSNTVLPGYRNEFHVGFQQGFGKTVVLSGDYLWKYTHSAFDFSILGNTPIFFPIDWHNSKTSGFILHADIPNFHNVSAFVSMSSVAARFFPPQSAGAGATVGMSGYPFRIDHDERFNQTTHVQYQIPGKRGPWFGVNWRFDSGQTAAATPCFNDTGHNSHCGATSFTVAGQPAIDLSGFTADQEFEAGLACAGQRATPTAALPTVCLASQLSSSLLSIPKPGTEDDDRNPSRIKARNLFDASVGDDNLLGGDKHKVSLRLTAVNLTNKVALYNFLSTFSGTHYVTPRALTAELGFHF